MLHTSTLIDERVAHALGQLFKHTGKLRRWPKGKRLRKASKSRHQHDAEMQSGRLLQTGVSGAGDGDRTPRGRRLRGLKTRSLVRWRRTSVISVLNFRGMWSHVSLPRDTSMCETPGFRLSVVGLRSGQTRTL